MKFFIDTANLEQIKEAQALGILDGGYHQPVTYGQRRHHWTRQYSKALC